MNDFEAVIGLEIHAQISTQTKLFCSCSNDSFGKLANSNVCPICMGFPGMLPVPNKEALKKAIQAALALKCSIKSFSKFDRKNYFYPDLPFGYQISQYDEPVSEKGEVDILLNGEKKKIRITRLHVENDAGKLTHTSQGTLLDFNRAGSPLMEIVSEPDLRNAKEAQVYAETIQKILRYCDGSACDMEKGMMRFDASVSIRPKGETKLYPRAEIKNLNSFRSLELAIEYEIERQIKMWKEGKPLSLEQTVGWDDDRGTTELMRGKESAADYRYFPEPDIPPLEVLENQLEEWKKKIPESPLEKFERFMDEFGLQESDAQFYSEDRDLANYFEKVSQLSKNPKAAHSFIGTILLKRLKDSGKSIQEAPISPEQLAELIACVDEGIVSNNVAKTTVFDEMMEARKNPRIIIEEKGLKQVSDTNEIESLCKAAIEANPKAAEDVKGGATKAMGTLIGYVMKESKGQANPQLVNTILNRLLL